MSQDLGARYWVPLVCLFHGLRIRETLQLHVHDITNGDTPLITIQTELDKSDRKLARHLKNDATRRTIPIHPELLKLGFMDFVQEAGKWKVNGILFPSSLPEPGGENPMWGRAYEQRFVPFLRDTLKFGHGYGNHSFRHTLEKIEFAIYKLMSYGQRGYSNSIQGENSQRFRQKRLFAIRVAKSSTEVVISKRILPYVKKINYPGLILPPPFKKWIDSRPIAHAELLQETRKSIQHHS